MGGGGRGHLISSVWGRVGAGIRDLEREIDKKIV